MLPELPLTSWEATKKTLHLWVQIVGKVKMAASAPRNHWWHVALYVDVRGLATRRLHAANDVTFEIAFDFVDHRLVVQTNRGAVDSFALVDGFSVAAFSHELISFGFWAGDQNVREPSYYSFTAPEPPGLREQPLQPEAAVWAEQARGLLALLPYEAVRSAVNPRKTLLAFLESTYDAGAEAAGWDVADLSSAWCPNPPEMSQLLAD
jgi:hypothetical protein